MHTQPDVNWHAECRSHDDVIKWKYFPRHLPFVRGIHQSSVNSPHKGQGRGALMFSLICAWINGWVNKGGAGNLRRHRAHFDVIVMKVITMLIGDVLGSSNDPRNDLSSQITTQIWLSFSLIREFCSRRVCLIQIFYMLHASKNVKRCMWKKSWRCEHSHFEYMYIYESLINVVANCGLVWMLWMERRLHCMECVKLICKCRE